MNKLSQEALRDYLTQSIEQWGVKYELQYIDYEKDIWTVPINLTEDRIKNIVSDNSIKSIRLSLVL
jgi:hypothetical protein